MRKVLYLLFVLLIVSMLFACKAIKNVQCVSTKYVRVVYITPNGNQYSFNIPYCDTIKLKTNSIDSVTAVKINKQQSAKQFNQ